MAWTERDVPPLTGRVAVVTGASSGIGLETARVLARKGARVVRVVRDRARGEAARADVAGRLPHAAVAVRSLDPASLESVKAFAGRFAAEHGCLWALSERVTGRGVGAAPMNTMWPKSRAPRRPSRPERVRPGTSPFPPLAPERIAAARERYGIAADRYLEHLRIGDPEADVLVRCFEQMPPGAGSRLLARALDEGIDAVDDAPAPLTALFKELDHVPFWVDWDLMLVASRKIVRSGLLATLAFAAYALPHSYLATGNRPLAFTSALRDDVPRRYAQTLRFVLESFLPGGLRRHTLEPAGRA